MSKNLIKQKIIVAVIIFITMLSFGTAYANTELEQKVKKVEYSERYKRYLELSEEERSKLLEPRRYDIVTNQSNSEYLKGMSNILKTSNLLRSSITSSYDYRTIIPDNVKIKNQQETGSCWAFTSLAVLETTLALADDFAGNSIKLYDYSEKHMVYGSKRYAFLNNAKNEYGINKEVSWGGTSYLATTYLTNGSGAIPESELPFENSEADIDISQIQNKTVSTTVEDTVLLAEPTTDAERLELISQMKQHIKNYGGLYASIKGAGIISNNYNNITGAMYYGEATGTDHAVTIIGWDDNYSKENFNEDNENGDYQPTSNGAWIIKNSWGEEAQTTFTEFKEDIYKSITAANLNDAYGWYAPSDISNDYVTAFINKYCGEEKVTIDGENITIKIGEKGYMYISYEDANVYSNISGIEKAQAKKDYYNLYQNDILGFTDPPIMVQNNHIYLANEFQRDSSVQEWLDKISIYTLQDYKCKVYVNPDGDSKDVEDLYEVQLEDGDEVEVKPGYRTLKFANPIKLTGNSFVVVVEITTEDGYTIVTTESKNEEGYEEAVVNSGESYFTESLENGNDEWQDMALFEDTTLRGNVNIKAFTTNTIEDVVLESIAITGAPTKTVYTEGEDFDKTGMVVVAKYSDGTQKELAASEYTVVDGENLTANQTTVTISYTEGNITKTTTQAITVNEEVEEVVLASIEVIHAPTKTVYTEGENFDATGMVVVAKYSNQTQKEITNYTVVDGTNLTATQTTVTISYTEDGVTKTTTQAVTVNEVVNPPEEVVLASIEVTHVPTKTVYTEGENFDATGMVVVAKYSNQTQKEITNYTVVDGTNLTATQTTVTISYTEGNITKTTTQAITVNEAEVTPPVEEVVLESIEVTNAPTKTEYTEGENFDATGMVVVAKYSNQTQKQLTASDYKVVDGTNLTANQTTVTISYTEGDITKTTTQAITVNEIVEEVVLESIKIIQAPTKTEYTEGENFDKTGMKVAAEYSDGTQKELADTDYTILDGENLTVGQTTVTIRYTENGITRTTTQSITVNEVAAPDEDREPVSSDFTETSANMESAKIYFYTENLDRVDVEIKIKISNIKIGDGENTYTYYYYLSGTKGDNNITGWKSATATKESDGTYSITISLKTEDIEKIKGIEDSDNLFVYIKEIAEIDGNSKELVKTMQVGNNAEVEIYLDGEKVGSIDDILSDKIEIKPDDEDDTLAPGEIPQAGIASITIIAIAVIAIIGAVSYHKFKNIAR